MLSADPVEPGVVQLYERWANRADLDAHLAGMQAAPASPPPVPVSRVELLVHDVSNTAPLGT